jgi:hypothetical protein
MKVLIWEPGITLSDIFSCSTSSFSQFGKYLGGILTAPEKGTFSHYQKKNTLVRKRRFLRICSIIPIV